MKPADIVPVLDTAGVVALFISAIIVMVTVVLVILATPFVLAFMVLERLTMLV